jgi:anti-sigma regulatory factor (Ser/Thr protein kinase)
MTTTSFAAPAGQLSHWAFFYEDPDQYADTITSFLAEGLAVGEAALVAVPGGNLELLRERFGPGDDVSFLDMTVIGRNPSNIIPAIRRFTDAHPGARTRFVGEPIWAGRSAAETQEATRHEALINAAFADVATTIVCPYRADQLDQSVLDDAAVTHPHLMDTGHAGQSPRYSGAAAARAIGEQQLPAPPADADEFIFGAGDLPRLRRLVQQRAASAGLSDERTEDFTLAVNEAASNTISHATTPGVLRMWQEPLALVCEICDQGHIADPLAGRRLPTPVDSGGHGLRVVNQVCDLVELRSGRWGTTVRMHMDRR